MCGRYTQQMTWRELVELYRIHDQAEQELRPRYNAAPTQTLPVVRQGETGRALSLMRWGLVPAWWKKSLRELPSTFNARAETVAEKPMFRSAFKARRCLVPASGYYEWRQEAGGKQPYLFTRRDGAPLTLAGLWERSRAPGSEEAIESFTIVVGAASGLAGEYHDRMPVILEAEDWETWLQAPPEIAGGLLRPAAEDRLQVRPVSRALGNVRNDGPELLSPA